MPKKLFPILSFFLLVPSLLANILLTQKTETNYQGELVTEVVDGDTFFIENRQPIRLYGLDAPELGFCYSQEAKKKLEELILNKKVILAEPRTDHTGRILPLVYIDGILVNEILIKNGFAISRRQGGTATEAFRIANDNARENNLGIFSPNCYQPDPVDSKCVIKGNINSQNKKSYFLPNCANYNQVIIEKFEGEEYFCIETEAKKAEYTKSKTCY
ncbi:thermonuclease family protein [Patescibacteria group bacterium]|nr:thermonuclease family protein [Patescibacteria group bacterium]